uniref:Uncharacterized protein n=1 Tax=Oryza sativa subsp. japonica TaxID=39947 RepID=Q67WG4_ORYSJ|nr:hypothetical protein [Oryza sativa Japonica Group]BAD37505.1 hypothetical protein [Oryza sativa Japonica Group]
MQSTLLSISTKLPIDVGDQEVLKRRLSTRHATPHQRAGSCRCGEVQARMNLVVAMPLSTGSSVTISFTRKTLCLHVQELGSRLAAVAVRRHADVTEDEPHGNISPSTHRKAVCGGLGAKSLPYKKWKTNHPDLGV